MIHLGPSCIFTCPLPSLPPFTLIVLGWPAGYKEACKTFKPPPGCDFCPWFLFPRPPAAMIIDVHFWTRASHRSIGRFCCCCLLPSKTIFFPRELAATAGISTIIFYGNWPPRRYILCGNKPPRERLLGYWISAETPSYWCFVSLYPQHTSHGNITWPQRQPLSDRIMLFSHCHIFMARCFYR